MSVLLVIAFLCNHFYEATVRKELEAHNYVLKRIVEGQEANIDNLPYELVAFSRNQIDGKVDLEELRADYESFNIASGHAGAVARNKIQKLLNKYGIDDLNSGISNSSLIRQKLFYDEIEKQLNVVLEELIKMERSEEGNDIKVIIKDRAESYEADKVYNLAFQPVSLNRAFLEEASCKYKIRGKEYPLHNFPIKFSSLPDSITFLMKGTDRVTGEKYSLIERHKLNLKALP